MTGHSPTPWAVCTDPPNDSWYAGTTIYSDPDGTRILDMAVLSWRREADAAFLVAAVNSHDQLVNALEAAVDHYDRLGVTQPWMPQARAALAAAKAGQP